MSTKTREQDLSTEIGWKAADLTVITETLKIYGAPSHVIQQAREAAGELEDLETSLIDLERGDPLIINDILADILE